MSSSTNGFGLILIALGAGLWAFRRSLAGADPRAVSAAPAVNPFEQWNTSSGGSNPFDYFSDNRSQPNQRVPVETASQPSSPSWSDYGFDDNSIFNPIGVGSSPVGQSGGVTVENPRTKHEIDILARTIWGEARGEGRRGMTAVANVVMNRVAQSSWPNSPSAVCQENWQFSVWNAGDPNRDVIRAVDDRDSNFRIAYGIADLAVIGRLSDVTGGADHYHSTAVSPYWADAGKIVKRIGNHIFYKLRG